MTTLVLGTQTFDETPTVAGVPVMLNAGNVPSILADQLSSRPSAGTVGRLFVDTTNNVFQRDNGSTWVNLGIGPNPVLEGTGAVTIPVGTTAQRPGTPTVGMIRYNTTLGVYERYGGAAWQSFGRISQYLDGTVAQAQGTTLIPYDNTTPTIGEGTELWNQIITPTETGSRIVVVFTGMCDSGTNNRGITIALFRDTTCIGAQTSWIQSANRPVAFALHFSDSPGTTSPVTYSARVGNSVSGNTWFIGRGQGATLGGIDGAGWSILEVV